MPEVVELKKDTRVNNYDVVATVGTYEKDGQKKYISQNVGRIIQTQKGPRLKLAAWFNPAGCERDADGSVWLALFEPKKKSAEVVDRHIQERQDDSIPF